MVSRSDQTGERWPPAFEGGGIHLSRRITPAASYFDITQSDAARASCTRDEPAAGAASQPARLVQLVGLAKSVHVLSFSEISLESARTCVRSWHVALQAFWKLASRKPAWACYYSSYYCCYRYHYASAHHAAEQNSMSCFRRHFQLSRSSAPVSDVISRWCR